MQSMSSMEVEIQRLSADKQGLDIKLDEVFKQKDRETAVRLKWIRNLPYFELLESLIILC